VTASDGIRVERMPTRPIGYIAFDVVPNSGPAWGLSIGVFDSNTIGSHRMNDYTAIGER
jgi:hypothetical protein